jgi:hypothetical protein
MIFLIEYDRPQGQIITFKTFSDSERSTAEDERLNIELDLNQSGREHEVVLLEAVDEDALRRTHRRYFEDLAQMVKSANGDS